MSLGDLLFPRLFLWRRPRLVVRPERVPFRALAPAEAPEKPQPLGALGPDAETAELLERLTALDVTTFGPTSQPLGELLAGAPKAVLVNAVDREPLLSSETQLLREQAGDLDDALELISRAAGHAKVGLAVPAAMSRLATEHVTAHEVISVPERYPQGQDELAVRRWLGAEAEGVAAVSLEAALAALRAIRKGLPTTERALTVVAADGERRQNVKVALGTPLRAVLDQLGLVVSAGDRVLSGGPMQGRAEDLETALVGEGTTAVMIVPAAEIKPLANDPCISCGGCVEACPMKLQVHQIGRNAEFGLFGLNRALDVSECIGCGLCGHQCPSGRPLVQWISLTKAELATIDATKES